MSRPASAVERQRCLQSVEKAQTRWRIRCKYLIVMVNPLENRAAA
jgi:hypothetical protein